MSSKVRLLLVFLAAALTAFLASGVILPPVVSAAGAAIVAGLAGVGILPPQWTLTPGKTRAVKRNFKPIDDGGAVGKRFEMPAESRARSTSFHDARDEPAQDIHRGRTAHIPVEKPKPKAARKSRAVPPRASE